MTAKAGKKGKVEVGANQVAEITGWNADISADLEETTPLGKDWKEHTATLLGGEGSAEGNWAIDSDANGQAALQTALLGGTEVALKLYVDETHYYSGQAFISNMSVGVEAGGKVEVSFDFTFNGAVSYN
ncbi:MAG: phage tail protein [Bacteroidales bacterium]|nr:phage tail protein [Bacteroidales bacterium]